MFRAAEERERADMIEKDRQLAIWTQAKLPTTEMPKIHLDRLFL